MELVLSALAENLASRKVESSHNDEPFLQCKHLAGRQILDSQTTSRAVLVDYHSHHVWREEAGVRIIREHTAREATEVRCESECWRTGEDQWLWKRCTYTRRESLYTVQYNCFTRAEPISEGRALISV